MNYIKTEWRTGDLISKEKLNHIEDGIESVDITVRGKQDKTISDEGDYFDTDTVEGALAELGAAKLSPTAKTSAMTQEVGKDSDGKLWTAPGGGSGQGWTTEQINLLDALLDHVSYTDPQGGVIADALIASLRGEEPEEYIVEQDGDTLIISKAPAEQDDDVLIIS